MRSSFGTRALQPRIMLTREPELAPLVRSESQAVTAGSPLDVALVASARAAGAAFSVRMRPTSLTMSSLVTKESVFLVAAAAAFFYFCFSLFLRFFSFLLSPEAGGSSLVVVTKARPCEPLPSLRAASSVNCVKPCAM